MYEVQVEYMPNNVKKFVSRNRSWLFEEVDKALDQKVPNLSGPITLEEVNEEDGT